MSHSFQFGNPTLTPNPSFATQNPIGLTPTMTPQNNANSNTDNSGSSSSNEDGNNTDNQNKPIIDPSSSHHNQHPVSSHPMQFMHPPHSYSHAPHSTHPHPSHPQQQQQHHPHSIPIQHPPPPLTHENDIVSDGLNDINNSNSSNDGESNSTHSNPQPQQQQQQQSQSNKKSINDDDAEATEDEDVDLNGNNNQSQPQPFPTYNESRPNNGHSTFPTPFQLQPVPTDDKKGVNVNGSPSNPTSAPNSNPPNATSFHPPSTAQYFPPQIGLNGVIPAPFSMVPPPHSQYNQHTIHPPHPNGNHANHGQAPPSNTHPTHNQHEFAIPPNHASYPIQRPNGNNINNGSNSSTDSNNNDSNKSPPSTTTGENGPNQQHPPNNGRVGWQFTLLPQQMPNINPMFGPGGYLPPDTYMRRPHYGEQGLVDVPHVTPQANDDPNGHHAFNAIITNPPNMSNNPPMITSTELDIEHGLNTNSHSNLDDANNNDNNSNGNEGNNRNSNSNNNKDKRDRNSSYSSKRSSKGNGRRKKRERENQTTTRKRRKRTDSSNNNNHRNGSSSSNGRDNKYVSIKQDVEASVKGGSGSGYRMVLDEPVNKSMLSCHQCKNKKTLDRIIVCGHVYRINTTVKTCTKKYCKSCLLRFYLEAPPTDNKDPTWSSWKCPCCRYICCCAWCRKKKAKRLESVSNAIRAEAHRLTPAISLARKLVSESRVNNNGNNHHNHSRSSRNRNGSNRNDMDLPPQI